MVTPIVAVSNLGPEFKIGTVTPNKINIGLGTGLQLNAADEIEWNPAALANTLSLAGATLTSDVSGAISSIDLTPAVKDAETDTTLSYDPLTKVLTYTNETGIPATLDLSGLAVDVFVNGANYDPATMVLTLMDNDAGTPDVTINLADLKVVSTQNTPTITWVGTGETLTPLQATVAVDPNVDNLIQITAAGLFVDGGDLPIANSLTSAGNVMTSDVNGEVDTAPIITGNGLTLAGKTLTSNVNGVVSNAINLDTLADETVTDAFGVTLFKAFA